LPVIRRPSDGPAAGWMRRIARKTPNLAEGSQMQHRRIGLIDMDLNAMLVTPQ
jgi:hypothetical protein